MLFKVKATELFICELVTKLKHKEINAKHEKTLSFNSIVCLFLPFFNFFFHFYFILFLNCRVFQKFSIFELLEISNGSPIGRYRNNVANDARDKGLRIFSKR